MKRCEGSSASQMVSWFPDDKPTEEFPKGYPGAAVCIYCSYGVLLVRGSVHDAVSASGFSGKAGTLRVHYVNQDLMSYTKTIPKEKK